MKKFLMMAMAVVAFTLASCGNSVESKAEEFVMQSIEALKSGNLNKVVEISQSVTEYVNSLSDEDKKVFQKAFEKCTEAHKAEIEKASTEAMKGLFNGLGTGAASDLLKMGSGLLNAASSIHSNSSEQIEELEGQIENMEDQLNNMSEELEGIANGLENLGN